MHGHTIHLLLLVVLAELGIMLGDENISGTKSNILFVICDSLDGRLLLDPNRPFPAPTFDFLISKGVTFTSAYSNSPVCTPARAAMWSGRHINEVQAWGNDKGLPTNYTPTFADMLAQNGYYNYIRGKEDYTSGDHSESGNVQDWTRSVPFVNLSMQPQPTTVLRPGASPYVEVSDWNNTQKFAHWLHEDAKHNQPYLAYLGLDIPHPWSTPAFNYEHVDVGGDSTFGTSDYYLPNVNVSRITVPQWLPWDQMHPVDQYSSISKNMTGEWTPDQIIKIRQYYYAMCMELDGMLHVILEALEASGTANNTFVVFTSDHGEMAMEHRQYFKMTYYEASAHVPLVISGPGVKPAVVTEPVSLIDLFPTFADMSHSPPPPLLNGTSLYPFLDPSSYPTPPVRPNYTLSQYHGALCNTSWYMLLVADYKYVAFGDGITTPPQLFDLVADPAELHDLSLELPDLVRQLDTQLRGIIDYPAVTAEVEVYNKQTFYAWQQAQGNTYADVIGNLTWFWDWTKHEAANLKAIEIWLNS